jgi:hypothetical protein
MDVVSRSFLWIVAPCLALGACSSGQSSSPGDGQGNNDPNGGADGSASADDGASPEASSTADGGVGGAADHAAGKAGADAFCSQICSHEQTCAATLDASPAGLADCVTNCQSANEAPTTNPPTELLRADYLNDLGSYIARASCSEALQTSETTCAAAIVSGSGGAPALVPTQAVAVFCHDFETSPCVAADSGTGDCVTAFMSYSDDALNAAIACFADPSCSKLATCYAAAFTQM